MVESGRMEAMFGGGVDCLQTLEKETRIPPQMSYNESIYSTAWPKLRVSGADIKAKEIILVSMALMLLATSLCLFYKNWKKNYRDINQLPYYSYMYKIDSPPPTVTRPPVKAPIMHWAKAAAAIGTQLTFSEPAQKVVPNADSLLQVKAMNNSSIVHSHLNPQVPGAVRSRPPLNEYSIPSMRINNRLQARLARIRRLAAAEMEKKAAEAANEESNLSNHSIPIEPNISESIVSLKANSKNAKFRLQAKRAQSDVHLRLKSLDLSKTKYPGPFAYQTIENKNKASYKNRLSNYAINEGQIVPTVGRTIKNSYSMSQCKGSGPLNWKHDSCQIPLYREDRLGSLQPLPEDHGQVHNLLQHTYREDTKDGLAGRPENFREDALFYYKNRSMSADMQNTIPNQNIRSNSLSETQNHSDQRAQYLQGYSDAYNHLNLKEGLEPKSISSADHEIIAAKVLSEEPSLNTTKPSDNESRDDDNVKLSEFSSCQKQMIVSERFGLNGNSHTSTDV